MSVSTPESRAADSLDSWRQPRSGTHQSHARSLDEPGVIQPESAVSVLRRSSKSGAVEATCERMAAALAADEATAAADDAAPGALLDGSAPSSASKRTVFLSWRMAGGAVLTGAACAGAGADGLPTAALLLLLRFIWHCTRLVPGCGVGSASDGRAPDDAECW